MEAAIREPQPDLDASVEVARRALEQADKAVEALTKPERQIAEARQKREDAAEALRQAELAKQKVADREEFNRLRAQLVAIALVSQFTDFARFLVATRVQIAERFTLLLRQYGEAARLATRLQSLASRLGEPPNMFAAPSLATLLAEMNDAAPLRKRDAMDPLHLHFGVSIEPPGKTSTFVMTAIGELTELSQTR